MAANVTPAAILRIPTALRLQIFGYLLQSADPLCLCSHARSQLHVPGAPRPLANTIAILRVCQLIHDEASELVYSRNVFHFTHNCHVDCIRHNPYRHHIQQLQFRQRIDWLPAYMSQFTQELGPNGQLHLVGIDIMKLLPNLRYICIIFSRSGYRLNTFRKQMFVIPFMRQFMYWRPRRFPRIVINNPTDWRTIIDNFQNPPQPPPGGPTQRYRIYFYFSDQTRFMRNLVRIDMARTIVRARTRVFELL
ncbi:hypothetical protein BT63DRAFT_460714 [Microthyrium microscopicum]|uniref:DUF7730 domain-containing protein n=1 Tax=Microthyrium microscopicum TaxID=703497 RepID=A0A6A6TXA3_9PEZI|nr:hypothetical protein BT63DRAFT_460714 [Microthyrium microscopicum]